MRKKTNENSTYWASIILLLIFVNTYYFFLVVFLASITFFTSNLFLVLGECFDFLCGCNDVALFAIYFFYSLRHNFASDDCYN